MTKPVFSLGHSDHSIEHFLELLRRHEVDAVADVRSSPYSRFVPHFSRQRLRHALDEAGLAYLYLGDGLGGKPPRQDPPATRQSYRERLGQPAFRHGIARLLDAASRHRVALVCRERDPLDCHRLHLVCRHIKPMASAIRHIMPDGRIEEQAETERRLLERARIAPLPLLGEAGEAGEEALERAYDLCRLR